MNYKLLIIKLNKINSFYWFVIKLWNLCRNPHQRSLSGAYSLEFRAEQSNFNLFFFKTF